ncbi:MAG: RidA family protein [Bryobacteraceae bacterium]|nr:RidA family protein [Bryobacteraceae bacterium]
MRFGTLLVCIPLLALFGQSPEDKLKQLNIQLPTPSKPVANYVKAVRTGNLLFLSGHGACERTPETTGKIGKDHTTAHGYKAAREVGVCLLATLKSELGDLRKVRRIVKVLGMVNATPEFTEQPQVINGFSDLMVEVFGDRGRHARSAVGMGSLPGNISVEIEMVVEVAEKP